MNNTEQQRFNEAARNWDEDTGHLERATKLAAEIRPLVRQHELRSALDYGAGTGLLSFLLAGDLQRITLMDTSSGMLQEARRKIKDNGLGNKMKTVQANLLEDAHEESYDLIYILMTLHHILDTRAILEAFFQHLNPGGWLCIADLDEEDGSFHAEFPDFDGHNGFNQGDLRIILQDIGFRNVQSGFFYEEIEEKEEGSRAYPLFLMKGRKPG